MGVCLCISTSFSDSSSSSSSSSSIASPSGNASITTQPIISSNASSIATKDNSTSTDGPVKRLMTRLIHDQNTLLQASSVLLLLVFLAFVAVVVKLVVNRRRASKTRKYGVLMEDGAVEIRPLEGLNNEDDDDDDEDQTLFEKKS